MPKELCWLFNSAVTTSNSTNYANVRRAVQLWARQYCQYNEFAGFSWEFSCIVHVLMVRDIRPTCIISTETTLSKKTGPLRLMWHNITNLQHRERDYWLRTSCAVYMSSDLTQPNSEFLSWIRTTYYMDRTINEKQNDCGPVSRPTDCTSNTCCNF